MTAIELAFWIAIAAAVGGFVARKAALFVPARLLWRFDDPDKLVIVLPESTQSYTGRYTRSGTGIGPVRAMALIAPLLGHAYPRLDLQRVFLSDRPLDDRLEGDLLLLGGPRYMPLTRTFLDELHERFGVNQGTGASPTEILWKTGSGVELYDGTFDGETIIVDHGFVIRARNPFNPAKTVILISGAHTFGIVAAARFIAEDLRNPLRHLGERSVLLKREFAALLEARVADGHVLPPRLLQVRGPEEPTRLGRLSRRRPHLARLGRRPAAAAEEPPDDDADAAQDERDGAR
jgi:hypothetical protein